MGAEFVEDSDTVVGVVKEGAVPVPDEVLWAVVCCKVILFSHLC